MKSNQISILLFIATIVSGCSNGSNQRYQIFLTPTSLTETYLVDTQKGRVWRKVMITDTKPPNQLVWEEMDVIDNKGEIGITGKDFEKEYVK